MPRDGWTLHPGGVFEHVGVDYERLTAIDPTWPEDRIVDEMLASGRRPPSDRYDEIYLQLTLVDLDDEASVLAFVNEFDAVLEIYDPFAEKEGNRGVVERPPYPKLSAYPGFDGLDEYDERPELLRKAQAARSHVVDLEEIEQGKRPAPPTIHEFRWAAKCICDLINSYRCLSEGRAPTDFAWENPLAAFDVEGQRAGHDSAFWLPSEIEEFLADTLAIGLAGFSPRIAYRPDLRPQSMADWSEHFAAGNDLWAVCCLELFNHVSEEALYKDCANEVCQRPFVRQIGRSRYGQRRRTGVRFCSHTCARAQAQRDYRRRRTLAAVAER